MADPLRVILVGAGVMGSYHLRVLQAHPGIALAAVVDANLDQARAATRGMQTPCFPALADALDEVEADAACIATPAHTLAALAHEALAAGLAVLVEKPMATSEADAQALVEDARERGRLLAVGLVERCNPAVVALQAKLADGAAGRVYQVHARRLSPFPARESPTGVALDLATHDLDVVRFLLDSEVVRVYAETAERTPHGAEDLLSASLRLESGVTGVLEVNWLTPTKVRELSVTTEAGLFVVNYITQDLAYYQHPVADNEWDPLRTLRGPGEGDMIRYGIARREPLAVQWDRFAAAVRGEGAPAADGSDGLAALSLARAIQQSGREHRPVVPGYRAVAA